MNLNIEKPLDKLIHEELSSGRYFIIRTTKVVNELIVEKWDLFYKDRGIFKFKKRLDDKSYQSQIDAQTALINYMRNKFRFCLESLHGVQELKF